jgi:hypothetical protein
MTRPSGRFKRCLDLGAGKRLGHPVQKPRKLLEDLCILGMRRKKGPHLRDFIRRGLASEISRQRLPVGGIGSGGGKVLVSHTL